MWRSDSVRLFIIVLYGARQQTQRIVALVLSTNLHKISLESFKAYRSLYASPGVTFNTPYTYDLILKRVRLTIAAVERQ